MKVIREGAFLVVAVVHLSLDMQGGWGTWLGAGDQAAGRGPWRGTYRPGLVTPTASTKAGCSHPYNGLA